MHLMGIEPRIHPPPWLGGGAIRPKAIGVTVQDLLTSIIEMNGEKHIEYIRSH